MNDLLGKTNCSILPSIADETKLPDIFSSFFVDKIDTIRRAFPKDQDCPDNDVFQGMTFDCFTEVTTDTVREVILASKSTTCELDPIPTTKFKENLDIFLPVITNIINESLRSGSVPLVFKKAVVKPLI